MVNLGASQEADQHTAAHCNILQHTATHEGRGADNPKRGGQHCGHPKEAAVSRGIETENPDKMAQLCLPIHLLGTAYPSDAD